MPLTLKVKSEKYAVKLHREAAVGRVIAQFGLDLPESRLLCFLDDEDPTDLKRAFGSTNRGLYGSIHDNTPMPEWPEYVTDCILFDDGVSLLRPRVIDDLIYLYGSAWTDEAGMTMTLAHELQHAIQHAKVRKLWAINSLIRQLPKTAIANLQLEWADIPTERDARIVAKRVALDLCGEEAVRAYIQKRMTEAVDPHDVADWQFIYSLAPSSSMDLVEATSSLFQRLIPYRAELIDLMEGNSNNPDFSDIDLDAFLDGSEK